MPLFECTKCGCVDNTALTNFWESLIDDTKPALCSACDPEIGQWHGQFERITADEYLRKFPNGGGIQYRAKKGASDAA